MLRQVFLLTALAHFYYGIYYDLFYLKFPPAFNRGGFFDSIGRFKYLTIWNVILQSIYFTICLLNDVVGSNEISIKDKPLIHKIKDFMYASVAFPVAMFVGVTFWALMAVDRELVLPKALDPFFPTWLNHVMHTNIMIFTLLEMVTSFHIYPKRSKGLTGLVAFMAMYLAWVHVIFLKSGFWVYPVLDVLNWWQRIIFFLSCLFLQASFYFVGETLNKAKWGKVQKQLEGGRIHKKIK